MKQRIFWGCLLAVLLSLTAGASTMTKDFKKTYDFQPGGEISVQSINGSIFVEPWNQDRIELIAEIELKGASRRELEAFMEEVKIDVDQRSGRFSVAPDYPRQRSGWGRRKIQVSITFWLRVPKRADLDLESTNAKLKVEDIEGRAGLSTTNGKIQAEGMRGTVDAHTTNGAIEIAMAALKENEDMRIRTTNGGIRLYLPGDINADVEASTTNGSISTDFPMHVRGRISKRRVRGEIGDGGGLIELSTTNGSIRLIED